MYSPLQLGIRYCKYYIAASNGKGHGVHSPFVYEFITKVLNDDRHFYAYGSIEKLRQFLLADTRLITIEDFGVGSQVKKKEERRISDMAGTSQKSKKFGQLLFRMVDYYSPDTILELGTSLGINTAYFASAKAGSSVITMEDVASVAELAVANFKVLHLTNIEILTGDFDTTLPSAIVKAGKIDFAYIHSNHRYESTIRYFNEMLPVIHARSILVFEDVHRSSGMERAWEVIKQNPMVTLTIDLFFIGIVLFRKENKVKQHFSIRV